MLVLVLAPVLVPVQAKTTLLIPVQYMVSVTVIATVTVTTKAAIVITSV